ncbi:probable ribonuclease 11 [Desmodus rotundus]|uniref:probable ribonuclease 11 n=1 Tax=Desmodus rotundus TaxID=9430 RepID=UPI002380CC55|nr:probable ribonuclease 11 [Desmodus rotundus]
MEVSLLLLSLGLLLVESSGNKMEAVRKEFSEEEMRCDLADSDQEKQTMEVFMKTLSSTNTSFSMSKGVTPSSWTFKRLHYSFPKGNNPGDDKENYNDMVIWRKVLQASGSCRLSSNFILGFMEVTGGVPKASSYKCGQDLGISCSESPELETAMGQLTTDKLFLRLQYHGVTSLKEILAVLTGNSLMSWLVSGSKL